MAPTLTAVVQQQTRVLLTLTWPGIQTATIQRLDPDGVLRNVRNAEPVICLGSCAVFDHEAPLDQSVSYRATSPQGTGTVAADAFGRTVGPGTWGNADTGQTWSASGAATIAVNGSTGTMSHSAVSSTETLTLPLGIVDQDIIVSPDTSIGSVTGGNLVAFVDFRQVDASNYFRLYIRWKSAGGATAEIVRVLAGTPTSIGTETAIPGATNSSGFTLRVQALGTVVTGVTVRARVWIDGNPEPSTWLLSATDFTIDSPGGMRLGSFRDTGNTNNPTVFRYDDLTVTSPTPLTVTSSSVTSPSGGQAWLTHPGHPQYAGAATVTRGGLTELRAARRGLFVPIGTSLPVAVSDVRTGSSGTLVVQTNSTTDTTRLRNILADGMPLLLRQPLTWGGDSWWVSIGDVDINRFTDVATDTWRRWTLPYQRVDRPPGASDGALGVTWNDVKSTYATWNAVIAAKATWTALNQSVT